MFDETKIIDEPLMDDERQNDETREVSPMDDRYWSEQYQKDVEKAVLDCATAWGRRKVYNFN